MGHLLKQYPMNAANIFPREDVESVMVEETMMAEEPEEAIQERLQRSQDQIGLIMMILHHRNHASDEEKLRQIRVVVE